MARAIVIPLYDHTTDAEVEDALDKLAELGFGIAPVVVSGYIMPADVPAEDEPVSRELRAVPAIDRGGRPVLVPSPLDELHTDSVPVPGRPGWRRDGQGREWYSAAWLGDVV